MCVYIKDTKTNAFRISTLQIFPYSQNWEIKVCLKFEHARTHAHTHTHTCSNFSRIFSKLLFTSIRLDFIHPFDTNCTGYINNSCIQLYIWVIILVNSIFSTLLQYATNSIDLQRFLFFNISPHWTHIFHDKYSFNRYLSLE